MSKFLVTLDPTKCLSYTLPDGRRFVPNRSKVLQESDIGPFVSAGVFLVQPHEEDRVVVKIKKKSAFRKKVSSPEINPADKLDTEVDKEDKA